MVPGDQQAWGHLARYKEITFILIEVLEFHHSLVIENEWLIPKGHKFSQIKELGSGPIQYLCHNCGELGHRIKTCDKPRNEDSIA